MYACIYACMSVCMYYVCMYYVVLCMYVCMYVWMSVCLDLCMYVCMHLCSFYVYPHVWYASEFNVCSYESCLLAVYLSGLSVLFHPRYRRLSWLRWIASLVLEACATGSVDDASIACLSNILKASSIVLQPSLPFVVIIVIIIIIILHFFSIIVSSSSSSSSHYHFYHYHYHSYYDHYYHHRTDECRDVWSLLLHSAQWNDAHMEFISSTFSTFAAMRQMGVCICVFVYVCMSVCVYICPGSR
jgi:hypothetical protein